MRERAAPVSIRYSMLVSGSVRVNVVVEGQAETGCGSVPMSSLVQEHRLGHLKLHVEQAATGLLSGSPLTCFLERNKGDGSSWLLSQNVGGTGTLVCGKSRRTAAD